MKTIFITNGRIPQFLLLACAVAFLSAHSGSAQFAFINLSYKVVLNPINGDRPNGTSDAAIQSSLTRMNQILDACSRGYRVRLVDPITQIGGAGQPNGPSQWFSKDFFSDHDAKDDMENAAKLNRSAYAWNLNAVNIYVTETNGAFSGGTCSFPKNDEIIIVSGNASSNAETVLHEIGHYFALYHTQGAECGCCDTCSSPGDDFVQDTLEDRACWDQNDIANHNFQTSYGNLAAGQRQQVDNTFYNLMSYRSAKCGPPGPPVITDRLTELQLDVWAFVAGVFRRQVLSGKALYLDASSDCESPAGLVKCLDDDVHTRPHGGPFPRVSAAVAAAAESGADVLILRPGSYNELLTITKPLTLRATRAGGVTIGQ